MCASSLRTIAAVVVPSSETRFSKAIRYLTYVNWQEMEVCIQLINAQKLLVGQEDQVLHDLNYGWRKSFVAAGLATIGSLLAITTSFANTPANCRAYAEDYSLRYSVGSVWDDVFRVRGRPSGSAMVADRSRRLQKSTLFNKAYAHCMHDQWP
jgi:hypothetical protein